MGHYTCTVNGDKECKPGIVLLLFSRVEEQDIHSLEVTRLFFLQCTFQYKFNFLIVQKELKFPVCLITITLGFVLGMTLSRCLSPVWLPTQKRFLLEYGLEKNHECVMQGWPGY